MEDSWPKCCRMITININWSHVECRESLMLLSGSILMLDFGNVFSEIYHKRMPRLQQVGKIGGLGGQLFNSLVPSSGKCCLILLCKKIVDD